MPAEKQFLPGYLCRLIPGYGTWETADTARLVYGTLPGPSLKDKLEEVKGQLPSLILEAVLYSSGVLKAYKVLSKGKVCFVHPEAVVPFQEED